jgi:hypothetical protein
MKISSYELSKLHDEGELTLDQCIKIKTNDVQSSKDLVNLGIKWHTIEKILEKEQSCSNN